jgi:hypothetical protein
MSTNPAPTSKSSRVVEPSGHDHKKQDRRQRIIHEINTFWGMTIYLWLLFFLFSLHESIVLAKYQIGYSFFGIPIVNALVLAKVMLIAEDLHLGERFKERPLIYPIAYKSIVFTIVFVCFHIVEESIIAVLKGKPLSESISSIGGGRLLGILAVAAIMTVALCPFFAFREIGRAMGERELRSLLFTQGPQAATRLHGD